MMQDLNVVNIKISLKLGSICYRDLLDHTAQLQCNKKMNFIVIFKKYTFTIFKPNALTGDMHCNVTKLKSFSNITEAISILTDIIPNVKVKYSSTDNITAITNWNQKVNLDLLFSKLCSSYEIKYNIQKFPAIFIRYPLESNHVTVFIFSTGKVICVGCKSEEQLKITSKWLNDIINLI